jgi:ACS family hexuronate transporter-like MFS transporter
MCGLAFIAKAGSPWIAILFCIGGFAHQLLSCALLTLCSVVFDSRTMGAATGTAGTLGQGGLIFTYPMRSVRPLFAALVGLDILGAIVLWTLMSARTARLQR